MLTILNLYWYCKLGLDATGYKNTVHTIPKETTDLKNDIWKYSTNHVDAKRLEWPFHTKWDLYNLWSLASLVYVLTMKHDSLTLLEKKVRKFIALKKEVNKLHT